MSEAYYLFLDDERDLKNVKWVELPKDYRKWYVVNSMNPIGKENIISYIEQFVSHHGLKRLENLY